MQRLIPRTAAALAAVFALTGAVSVSCQGDAPGAGGSTPGDRPASRAFGVWTPPSAQGNETVCTKEQHDRFFVVGPDGKKYPTWHPPALTDTNGNVTCVFGHEHGMNPAALSPPGYDGWDDVRRHFAFDANANGTIDEAELASAGIPFGYVTEYASGAGVAGVEPHESYKIVFANDRVRSRTLNNQSASDVTCDQLAAFNQDSASSAAFTNARASLIYAADCASSSTTPLAAPYRARLIVSALASYGQPNEIVDVTAPSAAAGRQVPTRERAFTNILVVSGQSSDYAIGLRERWNGSVTLARSDGSTLASFDIGIGTTDTPRFAQSATTLTARNSIDLCYAGLDANGSEVGSGVVRQARAGACAALANGSGPGVPAGSRVTAASKDSPFRGCQRFAVFGALAVRNNAGLRTWYSDVNGAHASGSSFTGALKQWVDTTDTGSSVLGEDPRIDSVAGCVGSVRLPN